MGKILNFIAAAAFTVVAASGCATLHKKVNDPSLMKYVYPMEEVNFRFEYNHGTKDCTYNEIQPYAVSVVMRDGKLVENPSFEDMFDKNVTVEKGYDRVGFWDEKCNRSIDSTSYELYILKEGGEKEVLLTEEKVRGAPENPPEIGEFFYAMDEFFSEKRDFYKLDEKLDAWKAEKGLE